MGFRDLGFKVAGFPCLALKGGRMACDRAFCTGVYKLVYRVLQGFRGSTKP